MNTSFLPMLAILVLAGCSTRPADAPRERSAGGMPRIERVETYPDATSTENTVEGYKRDLAQRITEVNSIKVYTTRPQALLRSVVVVRYSVDAGGRLLRSEIMRSNRDRDAEATAMASLRNAAPFPKPASHLLRQGKVELSETWLFNNDGRFQLRTLALPQMDQ
ncbi:TonB family protein [Noviherbaspirillum aerium]|uniref:TonB family protein n=1 Tax=Noviherbaspirillum aerium TaxID=2588497 RepID=UPI00384D0577